MTKQCSKFQIKDTNVVYLQGKITGDELNNILQEAEAAEKSGECRITIAASMIILSILGLFNILIIWFKMGLELGRTHLYLNLIFFVLYLII